MCNTFNTQVSRAISFIRASSMLMIVLCHIFNYFPITAPLGQVFNVGVTVFFILSGFLYGQKDIVNSKKWFLRRLAKLCLPIYLYYLILTVLFVFTGNLGKVFPLKSVICCLLNLNGLIKCGISENIISGHLWFITIILICYFITPFLIRIREKVTFKSVVLILLLLKIITTLLAVFLLSYGKDITVLHRISGIYQYALAFFISAKFKDKITKKIYINLSVAMIISVILRLCFKVLSDISAIGLKIFYDAVICSYAPMILGFWIFYTLMLMGKYLYKNDTVYRYINIADKYSYYIYIVHYMFVVGSTSVLNLTSNLPINLLIFIVATIASSFILKTITNIIEIKFKKIKNNT